MNYFFECYKKYAEFSGRARRKEFWFFMLFYIILFFILAFLDGFLGTLDDESGIGVISGMFILANIIPSIAVSTRRLHDIDKSGWWQLINYFVPLIGPIIMIFLFSKKGTAGENKYGQDPLAAEI